MRTRSDSKRTGKPPEIFGPCDRHGYIHVPGRGSDGRADRGRPVCQRMDETWRWFSPVNTCLTAPLVEFLSDKSLRIIAPFAVVK